MAHRIDIELTHKGDDATWTWRAAGARQPRGTVEDALVPAGATVGSLLRAEVETTLDGTAVLALLPPKEKTAGRTAERIEVLGTKRNAPDVNVVLAPGGGRRRDRVDGDRPAGRRAAGQGDGHRSRRSGPGSGPQREAGTHRGDGEGDGRRRNGSTRAAGRGAQRRTVPQTVYRNAALAELKPEELPVAEQLLRGGIPAVRQAIEEQNERARADNRPEVTAGPLLTMAERLLPIVNLATWKDRATAARAGGKDTPLREVRSIVASSSTVTLDDEAREMAAALRTSLDQRVTALREGWIARIVAGLDEGRVADAVRTSTRPPEPSARLSAELAVRLSTAAGEAMSSDTPPAEWQTLLALVVDSPVRRSVKPLGIPSDGDEQLLAAARQASGYVPELARLLGIPIPPPPGPRRPVPARAAARRRAS